MAKASFPFFVLGNWSRPMHSYTVLFGQVLYTICISELCQTYSYLYQIKTLNFIWLAYHAADVFHFKLADLKLELIYLTNITQQQMPFPNTNCLSKTQNYANYNDPSNRIHISRKAVKLMTLQVCSNFIIILQCALPTTWSKLHRRRRKIDRHFSSDLCISKALASLQNNPVYKLIRT